MKIYLGDSVYAEFDGFGIVLTTENGYHNDPRNRIVLEPEVYNALTLFVKKVRDTANMIKQRQKEKDKQNGTYPDLSRIEEARTNG